MRKFFKKTLFGRYTVKSIAIMAVVIIVTAIFGVRLLVGSHAATPNTSVEVENSTLSSGASVQSDSSASAGKYVGFSPMYNLSGEGHITGVPAGISPGATFPANYVSNMTTTEQQAVIAKMKALGVKWLRIDDDQYHPFYKMIQDAQNAGISVDVILSVYSPDGTVPTPAAMASLVTQEVTNLKAYGVTTYEIINEPNCRQIPGSDYAAILRASYKAAKSADPNAFILSGGLCPSSGNYNPTTYLANMYAAGAQGYFDAFNLHPYYYGNNPLTNFTPWNTSWQNFSAYRTLMTNNGDGAKQIWLTEFGCPTGTDANYPAACNDVSLAQMITQAYSAARALPGIGPLFIYDWQDDNTHLDGDFGLYTAQGNAKAASVDAFKRAADAR